jgi:uncharacterized protein (TIGR00255 family)
MILSMTGYGTGSAQKDGFTVSIEIRTVNHRFLDLHVRVPREYLFLEGQIQPLVRKALDRGRVEVSATVQNAASSPWAINKDLVKSYLEAAERLKEEFSFQESLDLKTVLSLPGILQGKDTNQAADDTGLVSQLTELSVQAAINGVLQMRKAEGDALRAEILRFLSLIEASARSIHELSLNSAEEELEKLRSRLQQLLPQGGIDPQRLAQEAALLAEKSDISEEVARLESHVDQFHQLIKGEEKAGKELDFLLQEMQREANTILSKSGNLEVARNAIAIKADIEKLREQVQNVE